MTRPQTFVEHDILQMDAARGLTYATFSEFWEKRMEPMQFIPREAKGILGEVRKRLQEQAYDQYALFMKEFFARMSPTLPADGCGGSPQAGGAQPWGRPRKEFSLEGTGFTLKDCGCREGICEQLKDGTCHA